MLNGLLKWRFGAALLVSLFGRNQKLSDQGTTTVVQFAVLGMFCTVSVCASTKLEKTNIVYCSLPGIVERAVVHLSVVAPRFHVERGDTGNQVPAVFSD